ncbi:VWA domain-containing protein [bacterium]|nr:VWA domain-containing protein [bacterium]
MKRFQLLLVFTLFSLVVYGNGVAVVDNVEGVYLQLLSAYTQVSVENQVAIITTKHTFRNEFDSVTVVQYGFPLTEDASAINLRWNINNEWFQAEIAPTPQDTSSGASSSGSHYFLKEYLGKTPLLFDILQAVEPDSELVVELTYVQLLPYEFGKVVFTYPNDYSLIQTDILNYQELRFELYSPRTITNIQLLSHTAEYNSNNGSSALVYFKLYEQAAAADMRVQYSLALDELGLFGFSTYIDDADVPDEHGRGYFVFVAEPDPSENTEVIDKVFTLIIDRSGSMSGDKIVQARNAATFIVNNLNEGDKFNIIDFATDITAFSSTHLEYNTLNRNAALTYINNIVAGGSTNISGAFYRAVPQFATVNDSTANIIIFFTDGEATAGIVSTEGIITHISDLVNQNETSVMIFCFGIGSYVNEQLLTMISSQNKGITQFLGDSELEEKITDFYQQIRNPLLLNTQIEFSSSVIKEVYPNPLPNLFKGQQVIVAGRYLENAPVNVTLSGEAFGQAVEYTYPLSLSSAEVSQYQFLTKIWAKKKMEYLLVQYYLLDLSSQEAEDIKNEVIELSMNYGIISIFTSYTEDDPYIGIGAGAEDDKTASNKNIPTSYLLKGNYPNPFNSKTTISFEVFNDIKTTATINIYNTLGQLIRQMTLIINGNGQYQVVWDGTMQNGEHVESGLYIFTITIGDAILSGKMTYLK